MLFEITKNIGEIELRRAGVNINNLESYLRNDISPLCEVPDNTKEIIRFRFDLNENGFMRFEEIMLIIEDIPDYKDKLMYKKGRQQDGDFTLTSPFSFKNIKDNKGKKNSFGTLMSAFFGRITKTKIFKEGGNLISLYEKYEKENNQEYLKVLKPFVLFCGFAKMMSSGNQNNFIHLIWDIENNRRKNGYSTLLSEEIFNEIESSKKRSLSSYLKKKIDLNEFYNYYKEQFNIDGMISAFEEKYLTQKITNNDTKKFRLGTIVFGSSDELIYMKDIEILNELVFTTMKDIYKKSGKDKDNLGINMGEGQCSLCGEYKNVYGNAISHLMAPFNQFTGFKEIYCSNGLNQDRMWANFPVCLDCILKLEKGKYVVQSKPFKNYYNGVNYYILPYGRRPDSFETVYDKFKNSKEKISKEINYIQVLQDLRNQGKVQILNQFYDSNVLMNEDIGLYFLFTHEPNSSTCIYKTIENSSLNKINYFNKLLEKIATNEYFAYYVSKGELVQKTNFNLKYHDIFLNECRNLFTYDLILKDDNSDEKINYDKHKFFDFIRKILSLEKVNLDFIVSKIIDRLCFLYRKTKAEQFDKLYYVSDNMLFIYIVLRILNGGEEFNMKARYIYNDMNEFVLKIEECMNDIGIKEDSEKTAFILGILISKILWAQKEKGLSGSITNLLNRKINSERDIIRMYEKVSIMILKSYKNKLFFCRKILELCSLYISSIRNKKINKDYATFALLQGFNLANCFSKNNENENNNETNNEEEE